MFNPIVRPILHSAKDSCGLLDSGLAEVSEGLKDHLGQLEFLSLRRNLLLAEISPAGMILANSSPSKGAKSYAPFRSEFLCGGSCGFCTGA